MKQILQSLKDGTTILADVPAPKNISGNILVQTHTSLVSAGTERMLVDFGKANLVSKARQQPDKVKMVLRKTKTDGVLTTIDAVRAKLDESIPLGYCNVGSVLEVGVGVDGFNLGDRVVSNAYHTQIARVPKLLAAKVPDNVTDEQASYTVLGAIGLQGIRLLKPTLGETVVVIGLGLIGLIAVQLLLAQGCRVLGVDFNSARRKMARTFGAETASPASSDALLATADVFTRGQGVDGVIITAATESDEPVHTAAQMSRTRGRIVLVGVTGLHLSRADFYEKELTFQVSHSYGPGRNDENYEGKGHDYPVGFVRWTEQRNFEAILDLLSSGRLNVDVLTSHRFNFLSAPEAYALLSSNTPSLGILLEYPKVEKEAQDLLNDKVSVTVDSQQGQTTGVFNVLGAGNYASRVLIPAIKAEGGKLRTLVSSGGISAVHSSKKYWFENASTNSDEAIKDSSADTLVIATRHSDHANQVLRGLESGKHVFCEKPLCLTLDDLSKIESRAAQHPNQKLMLGFNRRFAPMIVEMKSLLDEVSAPKNLIYTVNAGDIPSHHWVHDINVGGGRLIGEACHFIDLLRFIVGAKIVDHQTVALGQSWNSAASEDCVNITLQFEDGSVGVIHYLANGNKSISKERLEVFSAGRVLHMDNFRRLNGWGWRNKVKTSSFRQDKGQNKCIKTFIDAIRTGSESPIPLDELIEVSRVSIEAATSLRPLTKTPA